MAAGWTRRKACRVLGVDERRARRWQQRAAAGELDEHVPGRPMHGLLGWEVAAILALADEWGETDASHRKLAHRGSYLGRVWVSPATVYRVLAAHGRTLPQRPAREPAVQEPWPAWVSYRPNQVWGYDLTAFPAARCQALAIVDLVSRKWIDWLLCPEATSLQVQDCSPAPWTAKACWTASSAAASGSPTRPTQTPTSRSCWPCPTTAPR
jgi:hypothetical protein